MGDDDEFWEGYVVGNSDSNGGGIGGLIIAGFALAFFAIIYPFLPWAVVGFEIGNHIGNGLNILKWGGAVMGGIFGIYWNMRIMRRVSLWLFGVADGWKFTILCYVTATVFFFSLYLSGSENKLVALVCKSLELFVKWLFSYS